MKLIRLLPPVAALTLLLAPAPADATLVNRWSFTNAAAPAPNGTIIADAVSGANGVVVGNGASFTGSALTLPGTTGGNLAPSTIAAYVDLPNGLASSKENLTIEVWATVVSTRNWQRLVDFGKMNIAGMGAGAASGEVKPDAVSAPGGTSATDNLMLAVNRGTTLNTQRLSGRAGGAGELMSDSSATITPGVQYHFVIVAEDGVGSSGSSGSQLRWYLNGNLVQTRDLNFRLNAIADVNNWLGRSQFSGDSQANITYNEVRVYDHALTPGEITASLAAGPDATFPPPTTVPDSTSLHHNHKVRIPVLANDSNFFPATVSVVSPPQFGTATADSLGRILYAHTTGTPESDSFTYQVAGPGGTSAAATVTVQFTENLRLTNTLINVPANPPPTAYQFTEAFPGLNFNQPLSITTPPGETNRLFVSEKVGLVRVITNVSAAPFTANIFLNLPTWLGSRGETLPTSSEQGLLGLVFHPGHATNGHFFVYYSVTTNSLTYQRVSRFTVQAANTNLANPTSEVILFQQRHTAGNHNGGDLHFGPDGYLYISLGDGGDGSDTQGHSQKINDGFFAGIARIDVDRRPGNAEPNGSVPNYSVVPLYSGVAAYSIPANNPYIGATSFNGIAVNPAMVRTELYAVGLRNPWRMAFDDVTGLLYCGDVGQNAGSSFEEINIITNGGNYGWAFLHGTNAGPRFNERPPGFPTNAPLHMYPTSSDSSLGRAITGGIVYRGSRIPALFGAYIFADYVSGNVWMLRHTNQVASVQRIGGQPNIVAFGRDPSNGDVLMADIAGGRILRITGETPAGSYPLNLSETGLFADVTDLSPAPGVVFYEPNVPFWSDYAVKTRWFTIPNSTNRMTWSRDGLWTFPTNQIWVKHFDMELERGNPATKKRIETRLLVRNSGGVYGVSYQWNEAQTDAALVAETGADFTLNITNAGQPYVQHYHIPSRSECLTCHTPQAGHALSFTTRQLNRAGTMGNTPGNQLELLRDAGYFANDPDPVHTLPRHAAATETNILLEARVRSYLEVNCANCHLPGGTGGGLWDGRAATPLFQAGLINGQALNNGGDPANKLVVPGDTAHSVLLSRVAATNGFTRMPPLATTELDPGAIALLTEWIGSFDTNRMSFADWQVTHFGSTNAPAADPAADPDADGRNNHSEYLSGTLPQTPDTAPGLSIEVSELNLATIGVPLFPNAVGQVQTSTNLLDWLPWNVPGNGGVPSLDNPSFLQGPALENEEFFRLLLLPY